MNLSQFQKDGKYLMLALDHRGSFKKLINHQNPDSVSDESVVSLKHEIIESVKDKFSALLIDETYGLDAYPVHDKPFLLPLEKTGYVERDGERLTGIEYSVEQLIDFGARGAKLLLYFNPYLESRKAQFETARQVIDQCAKAGFPLFLEIVTYGWDRELSLMERPRYILDSLRLFLNSGVTPAVFKLEYPGDSGSCQKITEILGGIPWILLTRGVSFDEFVPQLKVSLRNGAQGFLAGRALWQEVCTIEGQEKQKFLSEVLPDRFRIISDLP